MPIDPHDAVVAHIARTRFPFPGQTTWPGDYVTLTNVPQRHRGVPRDGAEHFPDIVIVDGQGRTREIGEVEMTVDAAAGAPLRAGAAAAAVAHLRAGSAAADDDTPTGVRHFFVYVPTGMEAAAQTLLEANGISYAGVRGFSVDDNGAVAIVPFVTKGDSYDHQ
jgi:hypothetical protein